MLKNNLLWVGIFFIFLVSLIVHIPAALTLKVFSFPKDMTLSNPQGTIWQGKMQQVIFQQHQLGSVRWKVNPLQMFMGRLSASVDIGQHSDLDIRGKGQIGLSFSGLSIRDFKLSIPAQSIVEQISLPVPISADGNVNVTVENYQYQPPFCAQANMDMTWTSAQVSLMAQSLPLEEASAHIVCKDNQIEIKGRQRSQVVRSEYAVNVDPNQNYQVKGWLRPDDGFPKSLRKMLQMAISADQGGRYSFDFKGKVPR